MKSMDIVNLWTYIDFIIEEELILSLWNFLAPGAGINFCAVLNMEFARWNIIDFVNVSFEHIYVIYENKGKSTDNKK